MSSALERLGRVGVWSSGVANRPAEELREALPEVEGLGYSAIWVGEAFSRENLSASALALGWTQDLVVATGITNIYARDPSATRAGANTLGEAFPGRFLLGLGCSHQHAVELRGQTYGPPLTAMRAYLDAMDTALYHGPEPPDRVPVVLAALGPKMLDLARDRTDGAHPYFVPVEHTAQARERLGAGKLLAPEQAVILTDDESRGEVEHLRPERGEHDRHPVRRLGAVVERRIHRVQVFAHGRERRAVRLAAKLDRMPVTAAEAEQEAARERLPERVGACPRRRGIAGVDVRDSGGDDEVLRPAEGERGGGEVLPRERLADPDRGVAEPLDLGQRLAELLGGPVRHARAPHADPAEPLEGAAHAATVLGGAPPSRLGARWR